MDEVIADEVQLWRVQGFFTTMRLRVNRYANSVGQDARYYYVVEGARNRSKRYNHKVSLAACTLQLHPTD